MLLVFPVEADAQEQVNILITASPDSLLQAGEVTLNVSVSFVSANQAPIGDVTLYDPATDTRLMAWNNVHSQQTLVDTIPHVYVSAGQIGQTIPLVLRYSSGGIERFVQTGFTVLSGVPGMAQDMRATFTRTADRESVIAGTAVTLTYWVGNSGTLPIGDIVVTDELGGQIGTRNVLQPGDSVVFTSTQTILETSTSIPKLSYTNPNTGQSTATTLEPLTITVATPKLTATLDADTVEINAGDPVILTYTVVNEGNVPFYDLQISDETNGMIPGKSELLPSGMYIYTRKENLVKSADFKFTVVGQDGFGNALQAVSNTVKITVLDDASINTVIPDVLRITAVPSMTNLSEAGRVTFHLTISNQGTEPIMDVVVSEAMEGQIYTLKSLSGDRGIVYEADVATSGSYTFTVTGQLPNGSKVQAVTQPIAIEITQAGPTESVMPWESEAPESPSPEPSPAPVVPDSGNGGSGRTFLLAAIAVIAVLIVVCVVALITVMARNRRRRYQQVEYQQDVYDYPSQAPQEGASAYPEPEADPYGYTQPLRENRQDEDQATQPLNVPPPSTDDVPTRPLDRE